MKNYWKQIQNKKKNIYVNLKIVNSLFEYIFYNLKWKTLRASNKSGNFLKHERSTALFGTENFIIAL